MSQDAKRKALVLILLALVTTLLIAAALPRLVFQPGMPPPRFEGGQVVVQTMQSGPPQGVSTSAFFIVLILLIGGGLLIYGIYKIIRGVNWRELFSSLYSILLVIVVVVGLLVLMESLLPKSQPVTAAEPIPTPKPVLTAPLGPAPPILIWLVAGGLLLAAILVGVWMLRAKPRRGPELWELEAERARDALLAGEDLKNVILHCYRRMSQALQEEQQIERENYMTASEFEKLLAARGVPQAPVHQLTQLFEMVRYGHWQPAAGDEQRAISCLDAILAYSRETPTPESAR